jgi:hypothetical protein
MLNTKVETAVLFVLAAQWQAGCRLMLSLLHNCSLRNQSAHGIQVGGGASFTEPCLPQHMAERRLAEASCCFFCFFFLGGVAALIVQH